MEGQYGYRKGRGTIDVIYVLNYVVNRRITKKKGKIFAFFADLKAALDKVDKGEMEKRCFKEERGKGEAKKNNGNV